MSLYHIAMEQTLRALQDSADRCAALFSSYRIKATYQVVYTTGAQYSWRLIETLELLEQDSKRLLKRKMHCFESQTTLRKSITERILWKTRDKAFTRTHLSVSRAALSEDSPLSLAERAKEALDAIDQDLTAIEQERRQIKDSICLTRANKIIDLSASLRS